MTSVLTVFISTLQVFRNFLIEEIVHFLL